jgi:hypothetical protein
MNFDRDRIWDRCHLIIRTGSAALVGQTTVLRRRRQYEHDRDCGRNQYVDNKLPQLSVQLSRETETHGSSNIHFTTKLSNKEKINSVL